jgi:2-polyprenyl-6-methoxyphenol hydroxylase-like FAD-dependent oxidoreductase
MRVLIAGGGIGGLTTAIALRHQGIDVGKFGRYLRSRAARKDQDSRAYVLGGPHPIAPWRAEGQLRCG